VYSLNDNTTGVQFAGRERMRAGCERSDGGPVHRNAIVQYADSAAGLWDCELDCGGKNVFATRWFAWDISGGRSRQIENGDPTASFGSTLATSACEFDPAATKSIYRPQWTQTCYDEAYDPTTMELSRIRGSRGLTAQVNLQSPARLSSDIRSAATPRRLSLGEIPERAQVRRFGEHGNRLERERCCCHSSRTVLRTTITTTNRTVGTES